MPFVHKPWKKRDSYECQSYNSEAKIWVQQDPKSVLIGYADNGDDDCAVWMRLEPGGLDDLIFILLWFRMRIKK